MTAILRKVLASLFFVAVLAGCGWQGEVLFASHNSSQKSGRYCRKPNYAANAAHS